MSLMDSTAPVYDATTIVAAFKDGKTFGKLCADTQAKYAYPHTLYSDGENTIVLEAKRTDSERDFAVSDAALGWCSGREKAGRSVFIIFNCEAMGRIVAVKRPNEITDLNLKVQNGRLGRPFVWVPRDALIDGSIRTRFDIDNDPDRM